MSTGKLYIIPIPISEGELDKVLPSYNHIKVRELRFFVVEKIKTARQFLRKMDREFPIDDTQFFEQDKHNDYHFKLDALAQLKKGNDVGLLSEAGYPGVADPGAQIVALAHLNNIEVIPFVGPSSLLLALAASGMNGQGFTFNGYLPKKDPERGQKIKELNNEVIRSGYAQLFIETPYRNEAMLADLTKYCDSEILLTIAYDITGDHQEIRTKSIGEWKKKPFSFDKYPCVFVLGN